LREGHVRELKHYATQTLKGQRVCKPLDITACLQQPPCQNATVPAGKRAVCNFFRARAPMLGRVVLDHTMAATTAKLALLFTRLAAQFAADVLAAYVGWRGVAVRKAGPLRAHHLGVQQPLPYDGQMEIQQVGVPRRGDLTSPRGLTGSAESFIERLKHGRDFVACFKGMQSVEAHPCTTLDLALHLELFLLCSLDKTPTSHCLVAF